jgi:hypothetical protein
LFVRGFFKTGYFFGKPFVSFCIVAFLLIGLAEALWHFPGLGVLNSFGFQHIAVQMVGLIIGILVYSIFTYLAYRYSANSFEQIDL